MASITVSPALQGISGVAHGGYVAGLLAERLRGPARVTLRRPPPLDTPLVVEDAEEAVHLRDPQGRLIMEGRPEEAFTTALPGMTVDAARSHRAHERYGQHPYQTCFVCGTARQDGFGLQISGPDGQGVVVGVWTPSSRLLPTGGVVPTAFVWAVVDCVTAWSFADQWDEAGWWPAVTGQIALTPAAEVRQDQPHVVVGRLVGREGRRIVIDAAVHDAAGRACAYAQAIWVVVPAAPGSPSATPAPPST